MTKSPPDAPAPRLPLYRVLAQSLLRDIDAGRHPVGGTLPTEDELATHFGVSRHTVRQALRELKDDGVISSRAGVGTIVRDRSETPRFFSAIRNVGELLQFVGATEMQVLSREPVRADEALAAQLRCDPGQSWVEFRLLRHVPGQKEPLNFLQAFLPPELAGAIGRRKLLRQPIYTLVEAHHDVRVVDVLQEITAGSLSPEMARALRVPAGHAAIRISRFYSDARGRVLTVGIGHYPAGRYVQRTRFRAHGVEDGRARR